MYYLELFSALNKAQVRYLVVGGVAVNLHGLPRATPDIDLVIDLSEKNSQACWDALTALGYAPIVPVTKTQFTNDFERQRLHIEKNMLVLSFFNQEFSFQVVDVFIITPFDFDDAYQQAKIVNSGNITVPIVSLDALMAMKKKAGRDKDLTDYAGLELIREMYNEQ